MKTINYAAPLLAAAVVGAGIAFAPTAGAASDPVHIPTTTQSARPAVTDTDPATPYGTDRESPAIFGYHPWLGDDTDVPF
ncbi:hypothetical protein ACGFK1_10220 [Mycobacterium sp. NPDC048908]|uniref:hypothetical protein n=1 Tax=Mycobacterium sp. NPDC048908 TaxID=3364292 RepID=UPI00371906A8